MEMTRILGIDPGYDRVGWAVCEISHGQHVLIESGCIETQKIDIFLRYKQIFNDLVKVVKTFYPQEAAIESLFFEKNAKTAMRVSEARGVIVSALFQYGIRVFEYTPLQIKSAVTGNGKASKTDVKRMVSLLTKREHLPKLDDEIDAIATALCHAASRKVWLAKAKI